MRILGIDPGSRYCGYGVIELHGSALRYVECGVLTAPVHLAMEVRIGLIAAQLNELLSELRPQVAAMEDVFAKVNVRSALALAQARGMALAALGIAQIAVTAYAPALVKKTVTGSGRADKDQVGKMVQMLLGMKRVPSADASDALAVAIAHARVAMPAGQGLGRARLASAVVVPVAARGGVR